LAVPRIEAYLDIGSNWGHPDNTHMLQIAFAPANNKLAVYSGLGLHPVEYDWKFSHQDTKAASGRLRVVRAATTVYFLFAKDDTDEWILLNKDRSAERL